MEELFTLENSFLKINNHRLSSIPSCGLALLQGGSFDYVLRISSDDKQYIHINCHRSVLTAHSSALRELISGDNFWDMDIKVRPGYVSAAIELVQYMYLKDPVLISQREKVIELCSLFGMPLDYFLIREAKLEKCNLYPFAAIRLVADDSTFVSPQDFLQHLRVERAKILCSLPIDTMKKRKHQVAQPPQRKRRKVPVAIQEPKRYNFRQRRCK